MWIHGLSIAVASLGLTANVAYATEPTSEPELSLHFALEEVPTLPLDAATQYTCPFDTSHHAGGTRLWFQVDALGRVRVVTNQDFPGTGMPHPEHQLDLTTGVMKVRVWGPTSFAPTEHELLPPDQDQSTEAEYREALHDMVESARVCYDNPHPVLPDYSELASVRSYLESLEALLSAPPPSSGTASAGIEGGSQPGEPLRASASAVVAGSSVFSPQGRSFMLIYLDSTDRTLGTNDREIAISSRDPRGDIYESLVLSRESLALQVTERSDSEGGVLQARTLSPAPSGEYQSRLEAMKGTVQEFMWGGGGYTINPSPDAPLNPELEEAIRYLEDVQQRTRGLSVP